MIVGGEGDGTVEVDEGGGEGGIIGEEGAGGAEVVMR